MERNQSTRRLKQVKLVSSIVVIMVAGVLKATSKPVIQTRESASGIPPVTDKSLVALVQDEQHYTVHSGSDVSVDPSSDRSAGIKLGDAAAKTKPSTEEGTRVAPDWADQHHFPLEEVSQNEWTSSATRKNKPGQWQRSAIQMLHLHVNKPIPKQFRTSEFQQTSADDSKEGRIPLLSSLLQRKTVKGVTPTKSSQRQDLPYIRTSRMKRNVDSEAKKIHSLTKRSAKNSRGDSTEPLSNSSTSPSQRSTDETQAESIYTSQDSDHVPAIATSTEFMTEVPSSGPPSSHTSVSAMSQSQAEEPTDLDTTNQITSQNSGPPSPTASSEASSDTTASQVTTEPQTTVQVTSQSNSKSTTAADEKASTANHKPLLTTVTSASSKQSGFKTTQKVTAKPKPQSRTDPNPHRTTTASYSTGLVPVTNMSALQGSEVEDVKERTPGGDCADGKCVRPAIQWTDDAYWAFGSLVTVLLLLTVGVLYTGLWRKRNHMSNPISDVNCHAQASPSRKQKTDIKDLLKKKLLHIKNLNNSPLSSGRVGVSKHNGLSNGGPGSSYTHRYDRLPLLVHREEDEEDEEDEFMREWGPQSKEHSV